MRENFVCLFFEPAYESDPDMPTSCLPERVGTAMVYAATAHCGDSEWGVRFLSLTSWCWRDGVRSIESDTSNSVEAWEARRVNWFVGFILCRHSGLWDFPEREIENES